VFIDFEHTEKMNTSQARHAENVITNFLVVDAFIFEVNWASATE
jgi:hypothetical protein